MSKTSLLFSEEEKKIMLSALTLFAFLSVASATCLLPCLGFENGCVCNHSLPTHTDPRGQTFASCSNCSSGWRGNDCSIPVLPCTHGAQKINQTCVCASDRFAGSVCATPQCVHSPIHSPSKLNNECESCDEGYDGIQCTMCSLDTVCGKDQVCNTSLVPNNMTKTLECELTSPGFLFLLGNGRLNVSGTITLDCFENDEPLGLMKTANGTCLLSLFRKETNNMWNDEFFSCELKGLRVDLIDGDAASHNIVPNNVDPSSASQLKVRREIYITLLMIFGTAILVNGSATRTARKRGFLFKVGGLLIFIVLIVFVIDSAAGMREFSSSGPVSSGKPKLHVSYKFTSSHCECSADPPQTEGVEHFRPYCGDSVFGGLLEHVKKGSELYCDVESGACTYSHEDILANTPIDVSCRASECVNKDATEPIPPYLAVTRVVLKIWLACIVVILVAMIGFYARSFFVKRELASEFDGRFKNKTTAEESVFTLSTHSVSYTVMIEDTEQRILRSIDMKVESGGVLAIMGPSGAGKTTLLDILAAREKIGNVTGSLRFNGQKITRENRDEYKSIIAFVAQEDTLLPTLTVFDAVMFVARLSLPSALPLSAKETVARWAIEQLGLNGVSSSVIGDSTARGISGGERRRVSIAIALVSNPRILLLDEPTSGLDSYSALQVVRVVCALKHAQHPLAEYSAFFNTKPMVIMSIHQPSREVFELLDVVLLLSSGDILYHGAPSACVPAFERISSEACAPSKNPADYVLEVAHNLTSSQRKMLMDQHREHTGTHAEDPSLLISEIEMEDEIRNPLVTVHHDSHGDYPQSSSSLSQLAERRKYIPNSFEQCSILLARSMKHLMGSYHLVTCHTAVTLSLSMFLSYMYQSQGLDLPGALNRAGSISFVLLVLGFSSLSSLELFLAEKSLFLLERDNGYYSTLPYFFTKVVLDFIPLRLFPTLFLSCIVYYPMGLRTDTGANYLWFLVTLVVFNFVTAAQCFCVAMVVPSFGAGALISSLLLLWEFVFGGLMIQAKTIPDLLQPFRMASPFFLAFEALMVNELDGQACTFSPTDAYGNPTGYSVPVVCAQYLSNLSLEAIYFARDETLLCFWLLVYLVLAGLLLTFGIRQRR